MSNLKLESLLDEIYKLEDRIEQEIKDRQKEFHFKIERGKVIFEKEILARHHKLKRKLLGYIVGAPVLIILSTPVIYSLIIPGLILDIFTTVYQMICFPIYGISKVRRREYIMQKDGMGVISFSPHTVTARITKNNWKNFAKSSRRSRKSEVLTIANRAVADFLINRI